ncbi:hypothetical protein FRX31_007669 [Thalictrum thalictroides]|uniref:Ammonium transporter AmtB-like domain-containing protein n=1 Tax=Thalictrum thalictroides TaxID=46969 RepID=A0A7J6X088_THATH|nr:hypothetical protein FRX31_007669 [Thalictrum thalictroides]
MNGWLMSQLSNNHLNLALDLAMLCAGSIRAKNVINILLTNVVDAVVGSISYNLFRLASFFVSIQTLIHLLALISFLSRIFHMTLTTTVFFSMSMGIRHKP